MVLKSRYETKEEYIRLLLAMVATSQHLIQALERAAKRHPNLSDECGQAIEREKYWIKYHREELKEAYALPNEES
jgi:hypothetical protein